MRKGLPFLLLIIASSSLLAYPVEKYIVSEDKINVRVDSTIYSESLGYISKGKVVQVIKDKFDWNKIVLPPEFNCYISKKYTKKVKDNIVRVTAPQVNLRNKPSLNSYIIGKAPQNREFYLLEENEEWVKIQGYPYTYGWVHKNFLNKADEITDLSASVDEIIKLSELNNLNNKSELIQPLLEKGEKIIPLLETYMMSTDENILRNIIFTLTKLAQKEPKLVFLFLEKIDPSSLKVSSIYLDVLTNMLNSSDTAINYVNLAKEEKLSSEDIKKTKEFLQQKLNLQ
ncbi:MAG: SH3 domain-containing protein [Candidatus Omnitrophica bacterium]|jgi:uncharacterized protein YgiM (DUF1202 family)|nr:SH3 domain-containing protein [Candidatus Omnitrophota bacterium]